MTSINRSALVVVTALFLMLATVGGQERSAAKPLDREALASIQEASRALARALENMQEDIVADLGGQKERTLYRQADAILADLATFQGTLKDGASGEQLGKAFDALDHKIHELLKAVRGLGEKERALQRAAARVDAADEQLHYTLSPFSPSESRTKAVIYRQTRALVSTARQLEQTTAYALSDIPGRGVLQAELRKLADVSEQFQKSATVGADRQALKRDFATVNQSWERAIRRMQDLPPVESVYLLRLADRVDRLHEHLFRLLGMEGERPSLIIRT